MGRNKQAVLSATMKDKEGQVIDCLVYSPTQKKLRGGTPHLPTYYWEWKGKSQRRDVGDTSNLCFKAVLSLDS